MLLLLLLLLPSLSRSVETLLRLTLLITPALMLFEIELLMLELVWNTDWPIFVEVLVSCLTICTGLIIFLGCVMVSIVVASIELIVAFGK